MRVPRVVISSLRGSSGKTLIVLGLLAELKRRGLKVATFKKGPDYIDPAWLSVAAGVPCRNLDTFLMSGEVLLGSFLRNAVSADASVVEGNRGLYDGVDADGTHSTAELSVLLRAPVILVVDCTKVTRTAAAMVRGCQVLDERVNIAGVILNRIAGRRHEGVLRRSIERYCGIPVLGAVPKLERLAFSERHLGLLPPQEHPFAAEMVAEITALITESVDVDAILEIARSAPELSEGEQQSQKTEESGRGLRIGVIRDSAFQFYYPENLEAIAASGATLIQLSALSDVELPQLDGLYIGGGFPETHARQLTENSSFRESVRRAVLDGLPTFAECGGLVYLGEALTVKGESFPMCGVLPVKFGMEERPRAHGYVELEVTGNNPYFPVGSVLRGHEFRYSTVRSCGEMRFIFRVKRGYGFDGEREGIYNKNLLATFAHFHALSVAGWASALIRRARAYSEGRTGVRAHG